MSIAALAQAAAETRWELAPDTVRDRVVDVVVDCLAVTALGSTREELLGLTAATRRWAGAGRSTVLGSGHGWPAATAAFLNGCAAAADQLQDGHRRARGHPGSHVVPAVLALSEELDADGTELLSAVLAGYEVGARLGRAMGGTPDGVHDIGSWGVVAVAAGVARLLAPERPEVMGRAIELAASTVLLTDAQTVFAGHPGGHAFLGASVQLGLSTGAAAAAGLAGAPGVVDRHFSIRVARDWRPELLTAGLDAGTFAGYEILGGYLKRHPTCAHLHGVNDAVQDLIASGLSAADVHAVQVSVPREGVRFSAVASGELEARFSIPTSVAVAVLTGRLDETSLDDRSVTSPEVLELAQRVVVRHDSSLDAGYPSGRPAIVDVSLVDGSRRRASAARPRGDADRWFTRDILGDKASRLLRRCFGESGVAVHAAILGLAEDVRPRELGQGMRAAAAESSR